MRFLLRILDKVRPNFEPDGRFAFFKPLFDAFDAFCFSPSETTRFAPFARDSLDIKRYMSMVIIGLLPATLAGLYFFGLRILPVIAVSYIAGGAVEVIFGLVRKESINEGFLVTGLIFPLVLPPGIPLWMVAVGMALGVLIGKEVFGGTGHNIFNPALVGRAIIAVGYAKPMTSTWIEPGTGLWGNLTSYLTSPDTVTIATPLVKAKQGELASYADLFWGNVSGCIGETCAAAILLGGIFLIIIKIANWRTVVGILGSFVLLNVVMREVSPDRFAPVGFNLLAGGLLFGTFFMATDPVSSPITNPAKWAYGIFIGCVTLLIRSLTVYTEGVMFAILLGNIFGPLFDEVVFRFRFRRYRLEI
ncbi:MAG: RnfABCDGE type electron transport complex subunit D [Actinobacteria bacterium]|nr:RnfABCDGE type electron transport complex subunit D [Actinomycetota bacterium]